jgi:hypothetical protein
LAVLSLLLDGGGAAKRRRRCALGDEDGASGGSLVTCIGLTSSVSRYATDSSSIEEERTPISNHLAFSIQNANVRIR